MIKKIINSRAFQIAAGAVSIHLGLGWLGIIGGWTGVGTVVSTIGGVIWLVNGVVLIIAGLKRKT
ncbi:MAG: hypothetical protein AAGD25_10990 [Cyanobacteria bacterium P01_F01_bin.150]